MPSADTFGARQTGQEKARKKKQGKGEKRDLF
jgi:hypothetical protein